MKRRFWLASYPKSGNTWFRVLLANLRSVAPIDINRLPREPGIASQRDPFDTVTLVASGLLTHEECDLLRPAAYRAMARLDDLWQPEPDAGLGDAIFVKTHDAWTLTARGDPLLGGAQASSGAILIVRDPRDVVASLASHNGESIDRTIAFMDDRRATFCGRFDRQDPQLRQQLLGWSDFNASWLDQREIPVHLVRYEDLQADAAGALIRALAFAGVTLPDADILRAVRNSAFDGLRAQEEAAGFSEAPRPDAGGGFFRKGVSGGWRKELTPGQAASIETDHAAMMARLGYCVEEQQKCA